MEKQSFSREKGRLLCPPWLVRSKSKEADTMKKLHSLHIQSKAANKLIEHVNEKKEFRLRNINKIRSMQWKNTEEGKKTMWDGIGKAGYGRRGETPSEEGEQGLDVKHPGGGGGGGIITQWICHQFSAVLLLYSIGNIRGKI